MLECFLEVENVAEVLGAVPVLPDQDTAVDEREDDVAQIFGRVDTPMLQNGPGHGSEAIQGETTDPVSQLLARDMPRLIQPFHHLVE